MKIEANDQGFFVVKIFNEVNPEKNLTETNVNYIFSKFGVVSEIKYAQKAGILYPTRRNRVPGLKAHEIVKMGAKYRVETEWQLVKKKKILLFTSKEIKCQGEKLECYDEIKLIALYVCSGAEEQ